MVLLCQVSGSGPRIKWENKWRFAESSPVLIMVSYKIMYGGLCLGNKISYTVPADGLTPNNAMPSAVTELTIRTRLVFSKVYLAITVYPFSDQI